MQLPSCPPRSSPSIKCTAQGFLNWALYPVELTQDTVTGSHGSILSRRAARSTLY